MDGSLELEKMFKEASWTKGLKRAGGMRIGDGEGPSDGVAVLMTNEVGLVRFEWAVHNGMEAEWKKRVVGAGALRVKIVDGNHFSMMENDDSVEVMVSEAARMFS